MKTILLIALAIIVLFFLFEIVVGVRVLFYVFAGRMIRFGRGSRIYWVRKRRMQSHVIYSRMLEFAQGELP